MSTSLGRIVDGTSYTISVSTDATPGTTFLFVRWIPNPGFPPRAFQSQIGPSNVGTHSETCPPSAHYSDIQVEVQVTPQGGAQLTVTGLMGASSPSPISVKQDSDFDIEIDPPDVAR